MHFFHANGKADEFLRTASHGLQDELTVGPCTDRDEIDAWLGSGEPADEIHGRVGVGIDTDDRHVRSALLDDVRKEFVARAFGLKPDGIHTEEATAQVLPAVV